MESSGFIFNFDVVGIEKLTCEMTKSQKGTPQATKYLTGYVSRIGRDVMIRIGPVFGLKGSRVSQDTFIDWLKVSMSIRHFQSPSSLIETEQGDLLLDSEYANKIYRKGILSQNIFKGEPFRCGYNFNQKGNETQSLCRIWEAAIHQKPQVALPKYIDLLRSSSNYSDTNQADGLIGLPTAKIIWNWLLSDAGQGSFYYCPDQDSNVSDYISFLRH